MTDASNAKAASLELALPDSFHRMKRTVLLFSAALLVLGYGATTAENAIKIAPIDGNLPAVIARLMLTIALLYYVVGFGLEFMAAWRAHGEPLNSTIVAGHEKRIEATAAGLEKFKQNLEKSASAYLDQLKEATESTRWQPAGPPPLPEDDEVDAEFETYVSTHRQLRTAEDLENIRNNIRKKVQSRRQMPLVEAQRAEMIRVDQVAIQLTNAERSQKNLLIILERSNADVRKVLRRTVIVSRQISGERRFGFFVWEGGGVATACLLALLVSWTAFGPWSSHLIQAWLKLPQA